MKGASERARGIFLKLRPDLNNYDAQKEFSRIRAQIEYEDVRSGKFTRAELWSLLRRRVLVALCAGIIPSLTGAQVVGYYQVQLYQGLGVALHLRLILAGIYGTVCFLAVLVTDKLVIDTWGRRKLLLFGLIGIIFANVYTLILNWQFLLSADNLGKGFAVSGIYLISAFHCKPTYHNRSTSRKLKQFTQMPLLAVQAGSTKPRSCPLHYAAKSWVSSASCHSHSQPPSPKLLH